MVICLSIEYNGGYSGRSPSGCRNSKVSYCYLNSILLSLSVKCMESDLDSLVKWYADMMSSY